MRRLLRYLPFACAVVMGSLPTAAADRDEMLRWLITEEVSLLDWGVFRLQQDLGDASAWLANTQGLSELPRSGAFFDWRSKRVNSYVRIAQPEHDRTEGRCAELFGQLTKRLIGGNISGGDKAGWYLESVFGHEAFGNYGRPRPFGELLLQTVELEIVLSASAGNSRAGDHYRLSCSGRLDAEAASLSVRRSGQTATAN